MKIFPLRFTAVLILAFALAMASCAHNGSDTPEATYLQAVKADSIFVMAESSSFIPLNVLYGQTSEYGGSAKTADVELTTGGTYIHRIPLTGLTPDTRYYYRLGSKSASFRTAAAGGASFRFAVMGDTRTGAAIHDAIAGLILAAEPRFSIYGGDLCDNGSSYASYKGQFFRPAQLTLAASVPFFNATGNHEKWGVNTRAFLEAPASPSGNQGYYSFDYGDLHVVVMNYLDPEGYAKGSPQYDFIAADLAATDKTWKIVVCHVPAYSNGGHGGDQAMIDNTRSIFEPAGVDLVIAAHNHFYQRNFVNGIYHLVIGSAGAPLYDPGPAGGYSQVSLKSYCFAIFDLTPATLQMRVYNEAGGEIDALTISK